jgi:GABA permease
MRRILIVANRTLGGEHLRRKVIQSLAHDECSFYVLVPATPNDDHPLVWTEGESRVQAQYRLNRVLRQLRLFGAEVDGEVCDQMPLLGIGDVLRVREFDEIIISTRPPGFSGWIRQDLPHRVARRFGLPVTHIIAIPTRSADLDRRELAPIIELNRSTKQPQVGSPAADSEDDRSAAEPPPASEAM